MAALRNFCLSIRDFFLKLPLLNQARQMHWTVVESNKLLENIHTNIERLADKTDSHVALADKLLNIMADDYVSKYLHSNPKYSEPGRLNRYERQVFSQAGEDGI